MVDALYKPPRTPLWIFDSDFADAVISLAGSGKFNSSGDEPLIDAVDVVDDEAAPGSETP